MGSQQDFAGEFEDFLQKQIIQMGMTCTRNPKLPNGKTPDFLVGHKGRRCYVEATHIEGPKEFTEKKGEETLRVLLDESVPKGLSITLEYPRNEGPRLTNPVGRRDPGLRDIVKWLSDTDLRLGIDERNREFLVKAVRIEVGIYPTPSVQEDRAGWLKSDNKAGFVGQQHENVRDSLRGKYDKYTPEPDSLGDTPLIVALFDEGTSGGGMGEALYGTRIPFITLSNETGEILGRGFREPLDGVWLNRRSRKLERKHNHLAGVWHFRSLKDPSRPPLLFANPYRQDIESIIPKPMLEQRVTGPLHVDR